MPDYSMKEREAHKKLRQELKDRMANGEQNLRLTMINQKEGTIVARPESVDMADRNGYRQSDREIAGLRIEPGQGSGIPAP